MKKQLAHVESERAAPKTPETPTPPSLPAPSSRSERGSPALVLRFFDSWIRNEKVERSPASDSKEEPDPPGLLLSPPSMPGVMPRVLPNENEADEQCLPSACTPGKNKRKSPISLGMRELGLRDSKRARHTDTASNLRKDLEQAEEEAVEVASPVAPDREQGLSPADLSLYSCAGKIGKRPRHPYEELSGQRIADDCIQELIARFESHVCCITLIASEDGVVARCVHLPLGSEVKDDVNAHPEIFNVHDDDVGDPCLICAKLPNNLTMTETWLGMVPPSLVMPCAPRS